MKTVHKVYQMNQGLPSSPPTAAQGWTAYWQAMDGTDCYSDAGSTLCNNTDTCQQWNESLGVVANAEFSQATAGDRPTFTTGGDGSKSYLAFDGTSDYMGTLVASNFWANNAKTILMAAVLETGTNNNDTPWGDVGYCMSFMKAGPLIALRNYDGTYDVSTGSSITLDSVFVAAFKHDGGNLYDAVNNVTWTSAVASGNTTSVASALRVGVDAGSLFPPMRLYAFAVANTVISDDELTKNINYLKGELGI